MRIHHAGVIATLLLSVSFSAAAQTDPPPATTSTTPAPAPTTTTTPSSTAASGPTVTLGTAPTTTAPPAADPGKKKEAKPVFWADSQLFIQAVAVSTNTVAGEQHLSRTPTVESYLLFQPRFTISKDWQVRVRATLTQEWTDTAATGTSSKREPQFGDVIPSLWFRGIPAIPKVGIKPSVAVQVGLPTSKLSWARTMIIAPGASLQLVKGFDKVLGGGVSIIGSVTYSHPIYQYTTPGTLDLPAYSPSCYVSSGDSGSCGGQVSGAANPENIVSILSLVSGEWGKFSPAVVFLLSNTWAYQFKELPGVARLEDRTSFRQSTYFAFWLDWNATSWLTPEVGYYMSRNLIDGNGRIGNPFFDPAQDMRIYVGANIGLDKLYAAISGSGGDGGVVRAHNNTTRTPIRFY